MCMTLLVLTMLNTNLVAHDTFVKQTFLESNYVHKLTYIIHYSVFKHNKYYYVYTNK